VKFKVKYELNMPVYFIIKDYEFMLNYCKLKTMPLDNIMPYSATKMARRNTKN
jgi:hypothetical protein